MTENINQSISNLHPTICNKLDKLRICVSDSDSKYKLFTFPNPNLEASKIEEMKIQLKPKGIFINSFKGGNIQISWFANEPSKYQSAESVELFNQIIDLIPAPMSWAKLISPIKSKSEKSAADNESIRSVFEHDISRIVYSAPFKKLQNKTQVIPFSDNDLVHNRLTHSIEVASVGRKMARIIADYAWETDVYPDDREEIINTFKCGEYNTAKEVFINNVADIVSAACLIHDIGNPPYGHQGEEALKETYEELLTSPAYSATLGKLAKLQPDIFKIEGNAQTIRLLAQNNNIDLSYATLAASIKYPRIYANDNSIYKKFNIYASELELFNQVMNNCGVPTIGENEYSRHPLVYVVEAADDICYGLFDFEDFVHLGFITEETYFDTLIEFIMPNLNSPMAKKTKGETIEEKRANYKQKNLSSKLNFTDLTSKLRSEAMNQMISNAVYAFKQNYEPIIRGAYNKVNHLLNAKGKINGFLDIYAHMMSQKPFEDTFGNSNDKLKSHSVNSGYNNINVLKNSLGGYEVMSELLKTYITALHNLHKLKSQMVLCTIDEEYLFEEIKTALRKRNASSWVDVLSEEQQIEQIRLLNDYLTGLTDNAALKLFRHIKGHEQITLS